MAPFAIIAFAIILVAGPVLIVNRDVIRRRMRRRRQHRTTSLPFLFFPTTGNRIVPAWHASKRPGAVAPLATEIDLPVSPEPGIADLPPVRPPVEPGIADLPARGDESRIAWEESEPLAAESRPRMRSDG